MPRVRTTKTIAKRIDLSYHKQPHPFRTFRRTLVVAAALVAAIWGAWIVLGRSQQAYNPAPVTLAHAMFENNCAVCHDGDGKGGFSKAVSDKACRTCHDGAIHAHGRQVSLVSQWNPAHTSNCVECHVEHKGREVLRASSDQHCTRCHDNLAANVKGGTAMQTSVIKFDAPPAHPPFGRLLSQSGALVDRTMLRFNHSVHLDKFKHLSNSCVACHSPDETGERRYTQPISYEQHCYSCHKMTVGSAADPHGSMSDVRAFVRSITAAPLATLAAMKPEDREAALTIKTRAAPGRPATSKKIGELEWLEKQLKPLADNAQKSKASEHPAFASASALPSLSGISALLELEIAVGMTNNCAYCHAKHDGKPAFEGSPAGVAASDADLLRTLPTTYAYVPRAAPTTAPTTAPSTAPAPIKKPDTAPVATAQARRWFTHSKFNHDAHRMMGCIECHGAATASSLTSDVLMPTLQSCVRCHHPASRSANAASSNCTTCHDYHDRAYEAFGSRKRTIDELLR